MNAIETVKNLQSEVENSRKDIIDFLKEICAIPSMDSKIGEVGKRIILELKRLGFTEARFDKMGNVIGEIGKGPKVLVYDSHIDTVGIGDPDSWMWDPFKGKLENGMLFARGAVDEKGSTPGMVYGLSIAERLGLLNGFTAYYFGNMEEWCDGIAPNAFVDVDPKIRPDYVVIGEPTRMQVYRGHKGRVELKVVAKGRSAHAASNQLGDNAIYKLLPIIKGIKELEPELGNDEFLGHGKITVSDMTVATPSRNAVPDEAVIFIDRRMTFGETKEQAIQQIQALIPEKERDSIFVQQLIYDEPSYTGFVFPVEKYFPAWAQDANHPLVQAGLMTRDLIGMGKSQAGKWEFSTNGIYWAGKAKIASIGFGPGDEIYAHSVEERIPLDEVVKATEFYALLPYVLSKEEVHDQ